jgi:hypothetical protein
VATLCRQLQGAPHQHIDALSQVVSGTEEEVIAQGTEAALALVKGVTDLGLTISPQSAIIPSSSQASPKIGTTLAKQVPPSNTKSLCLSDYVLFFFFLFVVFLCFSLFIYLLLFFLCS